MFKKIWSDPVWSKVISSSIFAIISLIAIQIYGYYNNVGFYGVFNQLINICIPLKYLLILPFLYLTNNYFKNKKKSIYSPKQNKLREYNNTIDEQSEILFKWDVNFYNSNKPYIENLEVFCKKHGEAPIRFINNKCTIVGCVNSKNEINKFGVQNLIESDLIHKLDNM